MIDDEDFPFFVEDDEDEDIEIGVCAWNGGMYGIPGTIHILNGEECCTYG